MFSYKEYQDMIAIIKESGKAANFREAKGKDQFIIVRHDVEFSVDRAYALSKVEKEMDFSSTFFFQWTNNSYNILSKRNRDIITKMHEDGHVIGLHFALNGLTDIEVIKKQIEREIKAWNTMLEFHVDTFSIHRPPNSVLAANIEIEGITNAYAQEFFTYAEQIEDGSELQVKYLSDAQHRWNYGIPDRQTLLLNDKVQVLTHPYSWTEEGYDNLDNFRTLLAERNQELIETINGECKHFAAIRGQL